MSKKSFLLAHGSKVSLEDGDYYYDPYLCLNVCEVESERVPAVTLESAPTHSKTLQRPGDDDPDPGDRRCY